VKLEDGQRTVARVDLRARWNNHNQGRQTQQRNRQPA